MTGWAAADGNRSDPRHYPDAMKTFEDLFAELQDKAAARPAGSGTVTELDRGVHFIGKKLVEEAAESWMACQLLYHAQVMMIAKGYTLADVYERL